MAGVVIDAAPCVSVPKRSWRQGTCSGSSGGSARSPLRSRPTSRPRSNPQSETSSIISIRGNCDTRALGCSQLRAVNLPDGRGTVPWCRPDCRPVPCEEPVQDVSNAIHGQVPTWPERGPTGGAMHSRLVAPRMTSTPSAAAGTRPGWRRQRADSKTARRGCPVLGSGSKGSASPPERSNRIPAGCLRPSRARRDALDGQWAKAIIRSNADFRVAASRTSGGKEHADHDERTQKVCRPPIDSLEFSGELITSHARAPWSDLMLEIEIESYCPASVSELESIHNHYADLEDYLHRLISVARAGSAEVEATWLIKKFLETRPNPDAEMTQRLLELLPHATDWQARLHVLQCIQHLDLSHAPVDDFRVAILAALDSSNKLVRAWAYDCLFRLAELRHAESGTDMVRIMSAVENESPAVRARLRKLIG